uniref:GPI ethanolamine phosphate transferase 1 n=1 Tax=Strigamia maritima TaxID=126957 RepID=T1JMX3_STRMM
MSHIWQCLKLYGYSILAIVVHLIFSISIFDIYFKSTVIHGMTPHYNPLPAPAKRLVLFVVDGLRADSFYNLLDNKENDVFLKSIVMTGGIAGLSHCQVPTESRTGHVALIAGMNEDVSAVFTGWKQNPVDFDSVFNESRYTWSWGSPDILPIFSKNAERSHVFTDSYDADELDFASTNPSFADTWVFQKVETFLETSKTNSTLSEMLFEDKIVLFLHLVATDTLGSHGAGSWEETEVPIVAWGAGIRGSDFLTKYEIQQVDTAPLMAALIGVACPMNSVGVLPLEFFNVSDEFNANSLLTNAMQLISLSDANYELKKRTALTFTFREFGSLTSSHKLELLYRIKNLISSREYNEAIKIINDLINKCLDSIHYYETYDRTILNITISMGFISWMIYLISFILERYTLLWNMSLYPIKIPQNTHFLIPYVIMTALILYLLKARQVSVQYYAYFLIPITLLTAIYRRLNVFKIAIKLMKEQSLQKSLFFKSIATIFVLEVLVASFFHRSILTCGLLGISFWSWFSPLRLNNKKMCILWTVSVLCVSFFPLLPIVGKITNYYLVFFSSWLSLFCIIYFAMRPELKSYFSLSQISDIPKKPELMLLLLQIISLSLSIMIKYWTINSIDQNQGLLLSNQILAWMILISSLFLPLFSTTKLIFRLFHIYVSIFPVYIMMSTSYEVIFLLLFCCLCLTWILCEHKMSRSANMKIQNINILISSSDSLLTFFIFTAFFGTGNIASLSSFDAVSLFCFITVFHPFPMAFLLIVKVSLDGDFTIHCGGMQFLFHNYCLSDSSLEFVFISFVYVRFYEFGVYLTLRILLFIHMFLMVEDVGSWLDIGSSISRYMLMINVTIFLMLLYFLSRALMTKTIHLNYLAKIRKTY